MSAWSDELDAAIELAWVAGRETLRWFQAAPAVESKADGSPVTVADREAERVMRELLGRWFPADGILGEEGGETRPGANRRWVLDPIDGTRSFVRGVPLYGVMVALEVAGDPVLGVLHFPALGDTVAAARGAGCRWNGRRANVSGVARLEDALVVTSGDAREAPAVPSEGRTPPASGSSHGAAGPLSARLAGLRRLQSRAGVVRTWGDCYGYALVATGRAEAMLDPVLEVWDAAAVRPVVEEAGGVFTNWAGATSHVSGSAVATNAELAESVRRLLEGDGS